MRAIVSILFAVSGGLWLSAAVQRWWPVCRWGQFDDRECLLAARLEGMSLLCLAVSVALLPWLWLPRRIGVSLAVLLPAFCIALFAMASWTEGPSGSSAAVAAAAGAPISGVIWVVGLPGVLLAAALSRLTEAPPRTNRWRLSVAVLVGMSNPLASYVIGPIFTGYVSHDDAPWTEAVSTVFLVVASILVWPSSRALATTPMGERSASPVSDSPRSGRDALGISN